MNLPVKENKTSLKKNTIIQNFWHFINITRNDKKQSQKTQSQDKKQREKQTLQPGTGVIKYILKNDFLKNILKRINEI